MLKNIYTMYFTIKNKKIMSRLISMGFFSSYLLTIFKKTSKIIKRDVENFFGDFYETFK